MHLVIGELIKLNVNIDNVININDIIKGIM